jgi:hypothetical protein
MFDRESVAPDRGVGGWGYPRPLARPAYVASAPVGQPVEQTAVPNIPALTSRQGFFNSSGSLAMFAAIRRASSRVSTISKYFVVVCRPINSNDQDDNGNRNQCGAEYPVGLR